MSLTLDLSCLVAGGPQGDVGVDPADLERAEAEHPRHLGALREQRAGGRLGFFDLPDQREQLAQIRAFADRQHGRFQNIVVLGIGGSALGTQALHAALSPALSDRRPAHTRERPRLFVIDNVDPVLVGGILRAANPATTLYNVISKSGSTAETMSQFLLVLEALKHTLGQRWTEHVVVTTDAEKGFLRPFARAHDLASFVVPDNVGGRFSVLSPVGLVPGALMGWDLEELLDGAAHGRERCLSDDFRANPAAMLAATHHLLDTRHGHNVQVLFPYSHKLRLLCDWNVQLVAESLGKRRGEQGVGPTPHGAVGATDQHSQVQLFAEGPQDKVFTFLRVLNHKDDVVIPPPPEGLDGLAYLGGKTFGELLDAECRATQLALTEAGRPSCLITLPEVDARAVGELIMWLQIATAYGGELYGIDAFDQPGVEAGKVATYGLMGRPGYEDEKRRVESKPLSDPRWRIA